MAAFTVVADAGLLGMSLFYGVGDSLAPLISVNRGARNFSRMDSFLRAALLTSLVLGMMLFSGLTFFPGALAELFLPGDAEAAGIARDFVLAWRWVFLGARIEHGAGFLFHRTAVGGKLHAGGGQPELCPPSAHACRPAPPVWGLGNFLRDVGFRGSDALSCRGASALRPPSLRETRARLLNAVPEKEFFCSPFGRGMECLFGAGPGREARGRIIAPDLRSRGGRGEFSTSHSAPGGSAAQSGTSVSPLEVQA